MMEAAWEYMPVYMCFVDLDKAYDQVPREIQWEEGYAVQLSLERIAAEWEADGMSDQHL